MVARGAGAAGSVLLACRQWDPLALARWLPSLGVGAWRSAPLLPWRVQCPGCVCAALGPVPGVVTPQFPPSRPACPALCVAGRPVQVSLTLARWYAIQRGLCAPRARSGCPSGIPPRVLCVCVRSRSRGVRFPTCFPRLVWRAHLARSRRWALVGPFHAVRAPPRVLPRSRARFGVLWGGRPGPDSALPGLGLCAPRGVGLRVRGVPVPGGGVGGGGGGCAPCPTFMQPRGPVGRGVDLPRSIPPPSLGRQQSGCHLRRSGHGGRGPNTAPVGARLPSPGVVRMAPWRVGAGSLVLCGSFGSRRLERGGGPCSGPLSGTAVLPGGGGTIPPASGGCRPAPPRLAGRWGGLGGGVCAAASLLSVWGAACGSLPCPPLVAGAFPPGMRVESGSRGRPVHRVRPAWQGGGA